MKKDWALLWPMVAVVTILQIALAWFTYHSGLFGGELAPRELRQPLTLAWFIGIGALAVAAVHQDALPGVDQDWFTRPVARTDLLLAKLLFVVVVVCVPMLALDSARVLAAGFSLRATLPALLYKEVYFLLCFVVPVMALAAVTATMAELLLLAAALIAIFATALSADAWLLGAEHCPTCDTGVAWIQHLLQHAGILLGAGAILGVQYYRRRTGAARALAVIGTVALVFGQLPWSAGFGMQRWLSPAPNAAQAIRVAYDDRQSSARPEGLAATGAAPGPPRAPRNKLGVALGYLERHGSARTASGTFHLPVRIDGLRPDELLLVDGSDVSLLAESGSTLYRGLNSGALYPPSPVRAAAADGHDAPLLLQAIELPVRVYRDLGGQMLQLRLDYSLTLMKVTGRLAIPAANGTLLTDELGACAARPDQSDSVIQFHCQKPGRTPFCLGVIVRTADRENPEFLQCDPDYRPYLPGPTNPLNRFDVDVPIRDPTGLTHYPLEAADTGALLLLIKVYTVQEHAVRSLLTPTARLADLSTGSAR